MALTHEAAKQMRNSEQKLEQTANSVSKQRQGRTLVKWAANMFYPWNPLPKKNEFKLLKWRERK